MWNVFIVDNNKMCVMFIGGDSTNELIREGEIIERRMVTKVTSVVRYRTLQMDTALSGHMELNISGFYFKNGLFVWCSYVLYLKRGIPSNCIIQSSQSATSVLFTFKTQEEKNWAMFSRKMDHQQAIIQSQY